MKKIYWTLLFSLVLYSGNAYATIDIWAKIMSAIQKGVEVKTQVLQYKQEATNMGNKLKTIGGCFGNPGSCNISSLTSFANDGYSTIKKSPVLGPSLTGNVQSAEDTDKGVRDSGIYKKGPNSIANTRKYKDNLDSVVADEAAILFAKAATAKLRIIEEDSSDLYVDPSGNNSMDEILNAQNQIEIITQSRLARILELRAYMSAAQATAELSTQTQ